MDERDRGRSPQKSCPPFSLFLQRKERSTRARAVHGSERPVHRSCMIPIHHSFIGGFRRRSDLVGVLFFPCSCGIRSQLASQQESRREFFFFALEHTSLSLFLISLSYRPVAVYPLDCSFSDLSVRNPPMSYLCFGCLFFLS